MEKRYRMYKLRYSGHFNFYLVEVAGFELVYFNADVMQEGVSNSQPDFLLLFGAIDHTVSPPISLPWASVAGLLPATPLEAYVRRGLNH